MSTIKLNVKWGKQKFEVELDTAAPVELFKAQLFALTQVPPERQKIMGVKGGSLKDDADMTALVPGFSTISGVSMVKKAATMSST